MKLWSPVLLVGCSALLAACSHGGRPNPPIVAPANVTTDVSLPGALAVNKTGLYEVTLAVPSTERLSSPLQLQRVDLPEVNNVDLAVNTSTADNCFTNGEGASLTAGSSCNLAVDVTGSSAGQQVDDNIEVQTNQGPIDIPLSTQIVASNSSELGALNVTNTPILAPGATVQITVTNNGLVALNNIQINLASWLSSLLQTNSSALRTTGNTLDLESNLAPGALHTFTFNLGEGSNVSTAINQNAAEIVNNATSGEVVSVSAGNMGNNVNPALSSSTTPGSVTSTINFTQPNTTQTATFTNLSNSALTLTNVAITLPSGVSADNAAQATTCTNGEVIAAGGTCTYSLTASTQAYGSGSLVLTYQNTAGSSFTSSSTLAVAKTSVSLEGAEVQSFELPGQGYADVTLENTGDFAWQTPQAKSDYTLSSDATNIAVKENNDQPTATACVHKTSVAPGATCVVRLDMPANSALRTHELTVAAGDNLAQATAVSFEVVDNIAIGLDATTSQIFPVARRIIVTNDSASDAPIAVSTSITGNDAENFEVYNGTNASTPHGPWTTGFTACGTNLDANSTCYVYVHAKQNEGVGNVGTATLTVTAGGDSQVFDLTNTGTLYAGGEAQGGDTMIRKTITAAETDTWTNLTNTPANFNSVRGMAVNGYGWLFVVGNDSGSFDDDYAEYSKTDGEVATSDWVTTSRTESAASSSMYGIAIDGEGGLDAVEFTGALYRSTDLGVSWSVKGNPSSGHNFTQVAAYNDDIYRGGTNTLGPPDSSLEYSNDLGDNWTDVMGDMPNGIGSYISALAIQALSGNVYAAQDPGDPSIYMTEASGDEWETILGSTSSVPLFTSMVAGNDATDSLYYAGDFTTLNTDLIFHQGGSEGNVTREPNVGTINGLVEIDKLGITAQ